jgi:phosphatidylserine/phosphatidylglycerophosphate/cardiolipin synthase-like enzyme
MRRRWTVQRQWGSRRRIVEDPRRAQSIATAVPSAQAPTPYAKGSVHDFMHAKILVADDCVYVGGFNLSLAW